jgi:hypothetical protein
MRTPLLHRTNPLRVWTARLTKIAVVVLSTLTLLVLGQAESTPISAPDVYPDLTGTFRRGATTVVLIRDHVTDRYLGTWADDTTTWPLDLEAPRSRTGTATKTPTTLAGTLTRGASAETVAITVTSSKSSVAMSIVAVSGKRRLALRRDTTVDVASERDRLSAALSSSSDVGGAPATPRFTNSADALSADFSSPFPAQLAAQFAGFEGQPAPATLVVPGTQISYLSGTGTSPVAGPNATPTGSQTIQQVTITNVQNGLASTTVRFWSIDQTARAVWSSQTTGYLLSVEQGGEYWISPGKLVESKEGTGGGVTTVRLDYPLNGKTYKAIRFTTGTGTATQQYTYDTESGVLLVWGSDTTLRDGSRSMANTQLLGIRQVALPWIAQTVTTNLFPQKRVDWRGTYSVAVDGAYTATYRLAQQWDVTRSDALAVQARVTTQLDFGDGRAPQSSSKDEVFAVSAVWIDPAILARLRPGQVLDSDPTTGIKTSVTAVQNGAVVITEVGAIHSQASRFDLRTGLLAATQLQQRNSPGLTTVFLQRSS